MTAPGQTPDSVITVACVLQVHSVPPALIPNLEWIVASAAGAPVTMTWAHQFAAPRAMCTEVTIEAAPGTAAAIASALNEWDELQFDVTEAASPGCDAVRHSYTPELGLFSATTSANGDIVVPESRIRAAITAAAGDAAQLAAALDLLLGQDWDAALEPLRRSTGACWLPRTG